MQVCGAFCSGYWALKMLRIFRAKEPVFLRKPYRLCFAHPANLLCRFGSLHHRIHT